VSAKLSELGLSSTTELLEGPAAQRIIEYAQKQGCDLIVLSTHGMGGLSDWNISSVAQKILQRARRSILLIHAYPTARPAAEDDRAQSPSLEQRLRRSAHYSRICVPLDGSQRAECVLPLATAVAREHEATLVLAHAVAPPEMIERMPMTAEDETLLERVVARNRTEAVKYFEQLAERLTPHVETRVIVDENVANGLHRLIQEEAIDLVIVSAHGHSGQNQRTYGNLPTSLILDGAMPLWVVQDLEVDEIEPTAAEQAFASHQTGSKRSIPEYDRITV
jgi:nucleotide-binding universal stress UspA family protein